MNPMRPKDSSDIAPGWIYAIVSTYRQSKTEFTDPLEETECLAYENTLDDARCALEMEAEKAGRNKSMYFRRSSKDRFYGSDGLEQCELRVIAIKDEQE